MLMLLFDTAVCCLVKFHQTAASASTAAAAEAYPLFSGETVLRIQTFRKNRRCDTLFRVENKIGLHSTH